MKYVFPKHLSQLFPIIKNSFTKKGFQIKLNSGILCEKYAKGLSQFKVHITQDQSWSTLPCGSFQFTWPAAFEIMQLLMCY